MPCRRLRDEAGGCGDCPRHDRHHLGRPAVARRNAACFPGGSAGARAAFLEGLAGTPPYNDREKPVAVAEDFEELLGGCRLDGLKAENVVDHLRRSPNVPDPGVETFLFWSRDLLGDAKPVVGITAISLFPEGPAGQPPMASAVQVYASHYITSSLSITAVVPTADRASRYLVYRRCTRADVFGGCSAVHPARGQQASPWRRPLDPRGASPQARRWDPVSPDPLARPLGHLHPEPAANLARFQADRPVGRITFRDLAADTLAETFGRSVAVGAEGTLRDGSQNADLVAEVDREAIDVARHSARIRLHQGGCPRARRIRGIAEPVAGAARSHALTADTLRHEDAVMWQERIAFSAPPPSNASASSRRTESCIAAIIRSARAMAGAKFGRGSIMAQGPAPARSGPCR